MNARSVAAKRLELGAIFLLTAAAVVGAGRWLQGRRIAELSSMGDLDPIELGDSFEDRTGLAGAAFEVGCWHGYVINPTCGACQALALSAGSEFDGRWLSSGSGRANRAFAEEFGLGGARPTEINPDLAPGGWLRLNEMGLWFVPAYLVVREGRIEKVRRIVAGEPVPREREACEDGEAVS